MASPSTYACEEKESVIRRQKISLDPSGSHCAMSANDTPIENRKKWFMSWSLKCAARKSGREGHDDDEEYDEDIEIQ